MSYKKSKLLILIFLFIHIDYIKMLNNSQKIKIMCMGDSITFGYRVPGSYRKFLYHNLISKGYKIKMVGAQNNKFEKYYYNNDNPSDYFEYQDDNSGFSAYTICAHKNRKGLLEKLKETNCLNLKPDIIILLIGTNNVMDNIDFDLTINNFISLIEYILNNMNKNSILFINTIPDMNPNHEANYNWFPYYRKDNIDDIEVKNDVNNNVKKYNNKIKEIIEDYRNKNYNIRIEDLNPIIKDLDNLFIDGIHPNNNGYKIIGEFWTEIIDKYLKEINNTI